MSDDRPEGPRNGEAAGDATPSIVERMLRVVTEVRAGEGPTALLLTGNVFLLLTAYYVIKPAREAFLLPFEGGAEYKAYMSGAIAVALLLAVPAYAAVANRVARNRLVVSVTLFFASHLLLFYLASYWPERPLWFALLFYLWVGIFNLMVVAQFWAFANDVYSEDQGKRLFPLIGIGASVGAAAGSGVGIALAETLGVYQMLVVAAGILAVFAGVVQIVHRREMGIPGSHYAAPAPKDAEHEAPAAAPEDRDRRRANRGAFSLVFRYRYLTLIAFFTLVFTVVNTNGEYMLGKLIAQSAEELPRAERSDHIGSLYSQFFLGVNVLGIFLQAIVVSRLVKYGGLKLAFFVLPVIAFGDAFAVAIVPTLTILWIGKTAENATDYSINNTVRNMLWLPTTQDMKYKAKQAVDTFFVRMGDVTSGVLVFVLAGQLALGVRAFAVTNLVLVAGWLVLAAAILREQRRLRRQLRDEGYVAAEDAQAVG